MWSRAERMLAVGLLDGPQLLRMAIDPGRCKEMKDWSTACSLISPSLYEEFSVLAARLSRHGVASCSQLLIDQGWQYDEPWTLCHRDLSDPVVDCVCASRRSDLTALTCGSACSGQRSAARP